MLTPLRAITCSLYTNLELALASQTELGDLEKSIDDIVRGLDSVIHELGLILAPHHEERREIPLSDVRRKLQVHLLPVIEGTDRAPRRMVARNLVAEVQALEGEEVCAWMLLALICANCASG